MEDKLQGRGRGGDQVKVVRPKMIRDMREEGYRGRGRGKMRWGGELETPGEANRRLSEPPSVHLDNLSLLEVGESGENVAIPSLQMFEEDSKVCISMCHTRVIHANGIWCLPD